MYKVAVRKTTRARRKVGIRQKIQGTAERPRMSVFRSNTRMYVQLIDDVRGVTLAASGGFKNMDSSFETGKDIAKKALELKIKGVVFDRNGFKYHGRVKRLAEGAREGGLAL